MWSASVSMAGDGFVAVGMAPEPAAGWAILAGLSIGAPGAPGPALLRIGLEDVMARSYSVSNASATFETLSGLGQACPMSLRFFGSGRLWPCLLGEYGEVNASGPSGRNAITRPWAGVGIESRLSVKIAGPVVLEVSVDGVLVIDRNRFTIGALSLYETPPATARASAGLGLVIP